MLDAAATLASTKRCVGLSLRDWPASVAHWSRCRGRMRSCCRLAPAAWGVHGEGVEKPPFAFLGPLRALSGL